MEKENKIIKKEESYSLNKFSEMEELSILVKGHVIKNQLFTVIQGKKYIQSDGWAYAGGQMGIYPRMAKVENLSIANEKKWLAEVELVRFSDDKVVGRGFAICSSAESKKKSFDEYAILSQAQTRATGKAFRNIIGWIVKLGDNNNAVQFSSTPAEEMPQGSEVVTVNYEDDYGLQPELEQILAIMKEKGLGRSKQLQAIQKFAQMHKFKFDAFRMSRKMAKDLLAALLAKKLSKK